MAIGSFQTISARLLDIPRPVEPIDINTWTEAAQESLADEARTITSRPLARNHDTLGQPNAKNQGLDGTTSETRPRREPVRRDSLKRREALLKGKEGSRRRVRWENDHLLNNPWAQPPLPSDWEIRPTYPMRNVPYSLASLWDQGVKCHIETQRQERRQQQACGSAKRKENTPIARELRERMKKAKAAKSLLRDLEEQVRSFVASWEAADTAGMSRQGPDILNDPKQDALHLPERHKHPDDEEVVFVGRDGVVGDMRPSPRLRPCQDREPPVAQWEILDRDPDSVPDDTADYDNDGEMDHDAEIVENTHLVFQSSASDHQASFGRWLIHSIAAYYGLPTWSRTIGDPARREACVGLPVTAAMRPLNMPQPLWGLV